MKLNPDCIRDTLLYLEENLSYTTGQISMEHTEINISKLVEEMVAKYSYTKEESQYAIEKLLEVGYIKAKDVSHDKCGYIIFGNIYDVAWSGHDFLNNIRPKSIWDATKAGASKLGLMSIHALTTISNKIVEEVITNPIVINSIIENFK